MAAGDFTLFNEFPEQLGDEGHLFSSDTLKLGIVDATLTPLANIATPTWGDFSANEVTTTAGYVGDYVAGGVALTSLTWTPSGGTTTLDAANISLAQDAAGFTDGRWGILYNDTNATDMAIGFVDFGAAVSEVAGPIAINWNESGILTVANA